MAWRRPSPGTRGEAATTTRQPQPVRAGAAPCAAHPCRSVTSLPPASSAPTGSALACGRLVERSPPLVSLVGVRSRRTRGARVCGWRRPRPPGLRLAGVAGGAVLAGGNGAPRQHDGAPGRYESCGWRRPRPHGLRLAAGSAVRWWRGATTRPNGTGVRLAPPAPSRAAAVMLPIATTSYERPAPWPLPMHKCARDPALPWNPIGRPLCTIMQR
jgi:hypothetical protein